MPMLSIPLFAGVVGVLSAIVLIGGLAALALWWGAHHSTLAREK